MHSKRSIQGYHCHVAHCRNSVIASGRAFNVYETATHAVRLRSHRHEYESGFAFTGCLSLVQAHNSTRDNLR